MLSEVHTIIVAVIGIVGSLGFFLRSLGTARVNDSKTHADAVAGLERARDAAEKRHADEEAAHAATRAELERERERARSLSVELSHHMTGRVVRPSDKEE